MKISGISGKSQANTGLGAIFFLGFLGTAAESAIFPLKYTRYINAFFTLETFINLGEL